MMTGPAPWHALTAEIERRGVTAVAADLERIAERLGADIEIAFGLPVRGSTVDPQAGGASSTSLVIRITNELRDAQVSMRRAVIIARSLAKTGNNYWPTVCDYHDHMLSKND